MVVNVPEPLSFILIFSHGIIDNTLVGVGPDSDSSYYRVENLPILA